MGKLVFCTVALLGTVAGAAVVTALQISRRTGRPFVEALSEVPTEAKRWLDDVNSRLKVAVETGKSAAAAKEEEIERVLQGDDHLPVSPESVV
jgi:tetrahydromethanopterin S-methyltransferase subunit H